MTEFLFKTTPYQHQVDALTISHNREKFALFMEMGCGKSKVIVDNFVHLFKNQKINGVLILAPKGVYDTWFSKEIPIHTPDEIDYHIVKWSNANTKKNKKSLATLFEEPDRLNILTMNIEALSTKKGAQFIADFLFKRRCMFIVDESTTIKNHKAKRTINAVRLGKYAYYRRILTGSPVTKSPLDLYSQAYFLDEQKRVYKDLQKQAKAQLTTGTVTTVHLITQLVRLHQVSCGFVGLDGGGIIELPSQRLPELMEILEETDGKVIIWVNYIHDIQKIEQELIKVYGPESVGTYYGEVGQERRAEVIDKFQDLKSPLRFFVGNTQTGGYGITLTAASTVIYYSNNYDLEKRLQSEDRAHRIGQVNKVTYIDIVCEKTVDEKIVKSLRQKQNIAQTVLGEEKWKDWLV